jgi:uncharacterized membrane protein
MIERAFGHLRHHIRFYFSAVVGLAVWAAMFGLASPMRAVAAGDAFFAIYLVIVALTLLGEKPKELRERASSEDEGITLIILITAFAIVVSVYSIFALLGYADAPGAVHLTLALLGVPLGWATLHTVMAFHYAHIYYAQIARDAGSRRDAGGLIFPGDIEPVAADFLYHSFVIAMTAQVSDVQVCRSSMRRVVLWHGIASFFFNTVILALAVNVASGLTH